MAFTRIFVAGQDVADKIAALKAKMVLPSLTRPGCYDSETLCAFQSDVSSAGYIEAEIVESNYGFSVRYASGLQNFGLIFSAKAKQVDGTYEGAVAAAQKWQQTDPEHRYVSCRAV